MRPNVLYTVEDWFHVHFSSKMKMEILVKYLAVKFTFQTYFFPSISRIFLASDGLQWIFGSRPEIDFHQFDEIAMDFISKLQAGPRPEISLNQFFVLFSV